MANSDGNIRSAWEAELTRRTNQIRGSQIYGPSAEEDGASSGKAAAPRDIRRHTAYGPLFPLLRLAATALLVPLACWIGISEDVGDRFGQGLRTPLTGWLVEYKDVLTAGLGLGIIFGTALLHGVIPRTRSLAWLELLTDCCCLLALGFGLVWCVLLLLARLIMASPFGFV